MTRLPAEVVPIGENMEPRGTTQPDSSLIEFGVRNFAGF